jgi:hypothetical protein
MAAPAPRLYIITDRHATGGRPLVEVIEAAMDGARGAGERVAVVDDVLDLGGLSLMSDEVVVVGPHMGFG